MRVIETGERLYEVHETLGSGLQGKVKRGVCVETKEVVALKFLLKSKLKLGAGQSAAPGAPGVEPGRDLANLHREVDALRKVSSHKHVVAVKDVVWDCNLPRKSGEGVKETVLIVMELAEGGELLDFLMFTGAFNESIAKAYFLQLMSALSHCHASNIAHRDLKPENLLMDKDYVLKVADFGLSAVSDETVLLRTQCGTPGYMAPEIIRLEPYRGQAADVWSSGVLLFIMLTGFPPFYMAKPGDWWFDRIRANQHHLFWQAHARNAGAFSPGAMALMNKMFQSNPADRATVKDILDDPWLTGGGVVSPAVLSADMGRRHAEVVSRKAQEREEMRKKKEAEKLAKAAAKPRVDPFARRVVRAVGEDGDSGAGAGAGSGSGSSSASLPPKCPELRHNTWFVAPQSVGDVMGAIGSAVEKLSATTVKRNDAGWKHKATYTSASGLTVAFTARAYRAGAGAEEEEEDKDAGVSMSGDVEDVVVDVQRTAGDGMVFQEVFAGLCRELGAAAPAHIPVMPKAPTDLPTDGDAGAPPPAPAALSAAASVSERVTLL